MAEQQKSTGQQATQQMQQIKQNIPQQQSTKTYTKVASKTLQKPSATGRGSTDSPAVTKAKPALTAAEVERMIDLGLGRGVDSTNPKPWNNKSAFQVRRVTPESVIGTEEGGSLQSYDHRVTSVTAHQADLKAAVEVPQAPVQVGIDAEASRNLATTRKTVGKKVVTRSISFRSEFEDVPYGTTRYDESLDWVSHIDPDSSVADTQSEYYTFEERLSKWIVVRILHRQEKTAQKKVAAGKDPGEPKFKLDEATGIADPFSVISNFLQISSPEEKRQIAQDCYDFVAHFRITHYVSSIDLGASEYRVLSETEHTTRLGAKGTFGVEQLANLSVSQSSTWKRTKKASDLRSIGKMTRDGHVSRGTHDEAVVGIKVQPISSLVKLPYLNLAMRSALLRYMDQQQKSSGPFLLMCVGERALYLSVDNTNYTILATTDISNASPFFIFPTDEGNHPFEFHIAYKNNNQRLQKRRDSSHTSKPEQATEQIPRYLSVPLTICGVNKGPLQLKHLIMEEGRLVLQTRIGKDKGPVNPHDWLNGKEVFFIKCARRKFKRDGYICVKQQRRGGEDEWITACVPFKFLHDEREFFMLFQLLPASYKPQSQDTSARHTEATATESPKVKLEQELELLAKGSAPEKFKVPLFKQRAMKYKPRADSEDTERLIRKSSELKPLTQVHLDTSGSKTSDPSIATQDTTL